MSRRNGAILLYAVVAYGFTWTVWLPYLLAARRGNPMPPPLLYYFAGFGPLLACIGAEALERGCPAFGTSSTACTIGVGPAFG
jgi:hypothetical protein